MARHALRSRRRFGGCLEPMHTLGLHLAGTGELMELRAASLSQPRHYLISDLVRMDSAGRALRWLRDVVPPKSPEPALWRSVSAFLDVLDDRADTAPLARLADFGLHLLALLGWGLQLESCVGCGKPCPASASAGVDPKRGGLVCRACGRTQIVVGAELRKRLALAAKGVAGCCTVDDAPLSLSLIEQVLEVHAGMSQLRSDR